MMKPSRLLPLLPLLLTLPACHSTPAAVTSNITRADNFSEINPRDVAVLRIDDQTGGKLEEIEDYLYGCLCRQLVRRNYSPISPGHVDASFGRDLPAKASREGMSIVRPAFMSKLASKAGEHAILAVQIVAWDDSQLLLDNRVTFRANVAMLDSKNRRILLDGSVSGSVEAGGAAAAPRAPEARRRAAALEFARQLALKLPSRQPL